MSLRFRPRPLRQAALAGVLCLAVAWLPGCLFDSDERACHRVEGTAMSDSVAILLHEVHAGQVVPVRLTGEYAWCWQLLRTDVEARGDTILLRPIIEGTECDPPASPCPPGIRAFADTLLLHPSQPGPLWVRALGGSRRLVDSTIVLP